MLLLIVRTALKLPFIASNYQNKRDTKDATREFEWLKQRVTKKELSELDGVDSVLSLLDAPIFFQPKVGLTEVADNLKDLTSDGIDFIQAKKEIINNPIYRDLIISKDGSTTAMQIVLQGNNEYDALVSDRYKILDILKSKEPIAFEDKTKLQSELTTVNKRISELNDNESAFNATLVSQIRSILDLHRNNATLYLGGPAMITTDMMEYIRSDLVIFGVSVASIFAIMLYLFFGNIKFVVLPISNAFLTTFVTAGFIGYILQAFRNFLTGTSKLVCSAAYSSL